MPRNKLALSGVSVAGIETAIEVPSLKLVLDMGACSRTAVNQRWVLVSHGHLDHAGALPQHAARRALLKMPEPVYLVPRAISGAIERLFNAAGEIDGQTIPRRVVPIEPGEEFPLPGGRSIRPFATFHRVPSQGYTVWEQRHRLRAEFQGKPGVELGRLRQQGVVLDEAHPVALLAFTGDTRVEVLERASDLHVAETLILETSFLDDRVSIADAREMGHVHLHEVIERRELLRNENVVFSHFSARYSPGEVRSLLQRLPDELRERVSPLL